MQRIVKRIPPGKGTRFRMSAKKMIGGGRNPEKATERLINKSQRLKRRNELTPGQIQSLAEKLIQQAAYWADHFENEQIKQGNKTDWNSYFHAWLIPIEARVPIRIKKEIRRRTLPKSEK